jgi:hypothetical protein
VLFRNYAFVNKNRLISFYQSLAVDSAAAKFEKKTDEDHYDLDGNDL